MIFQTEMFCQRIIALYLSPNTNFRDYLWRRFTGCAPVCGPRITYRYTSPVRARQPSYHITASAFRLLRTAYVIQGWIPEEIDFWCISECKTVYNHFFHTIGCSSWSAARQWAKHYLVAQTEALDWFWDLNPSFWSVSLTFIGVTEKSYNPLCTGDWLFSSARDSGCPILPSATNKSGPSAVCFLFRLWLV